MFSIIIPTFNRSESIKQCLNSLVNQTFKFFEVIICDDGSVDNTDDVVKLFVDKLQINYTWEENWGGPARPRNNGIKLAKGKWICFLDSDDIWYDNKLEVLENYINVNPHLEFVCHDLIINNILSKKTNLLSCGPIVDNLYSDLLKKGNRFPNSAISIKKTIFEKHKIFFTESRDLISVEDYDLTLNLARCNISFGCINEVLGEYRLEKNNISSQIRHLQNLEFLLKKHVFEIQTFESNKNLLWKQVLARLSTIKATDSFRRSKYWDSFLFFFSAFKYSRNGFYNYVSDRFKLVLKNTRYKLGYKNFLNN